MVETHPEPDVPGTQGPLKPSKKIVFVHHGSFVGGGSSISLINTLKWLKQNADFELKLWCPHKVVNDHIQNTLGIEAFTMPNPMKLIGKVLIGWAPWYRLKTARVFLRQLVHLPASIIAQVRCFHKERPGLVHLNSAILVSSAISARILGIPLVWHVREINLGSSLNLRRRFTGWLIRRLADTVVTISPVEAERIGGTRSPNVKVVYNYIDFEKFDLAKFDPAAIRDKLGIERDAKVLITLGGSANFRKGIVQLLGSMKYTDKDVTLLVVGPKHQHQQLSMGKRIYRNAVHGVENLLVTLGLVGTFSRYYDYRVEKTLSKLPAEIVNNRIVWVGEVFEVAPFVAAADVLVFAGMTPHFPRPVFEGWAMKKPALVFDVDGIRQNIDSGIDGLLVKPKSGKPLGIAANALIHDEEKCRAMGESGWHKSFDLFRVDKNIRKIVRIYEQLLLGKEDKDDGR